MRKGNLLLTFLLSISIAGVCAKAVCADGQTVVAFRLDQKGIADGAYSMWVTKNAARVDFPRINMYCVTESPSGRAAMVNTKTHDYYEMPVAKWFDSGLHIGDNATINDVPVQIPARWRDKEAILLSRKIKPEDSHLNKAEGLFRDGKERGVECNAENVLYSKEIEVSPQVAVFLEGVFRVPSTKVLLQRTQIFPDGHTQVVLETQKVSQEPVPAKFFRVPAHCRLVNNRRAATGELRQRTEAGELIEDLFR